MHIELCQRWGAKTFCIGTAQHERGKRLEREPELGLGGGTEIAVVLMAHRKLGLQHAMHRDRELQIFGDGMALSGIAGAALSDDQIVFRLGIWHIPDLLVAVFGAEGHAQRARGQVEQGTTQTEIPTGCLVVRRAMGIGFYGIQGSVTVAYTPKGNIEPAFDGRLQVIPVDVAMLAALIGLGASIVVAHIVVPVLLEPGHVEIALEAQDAAHGQIIDVIHPGA